MALMPADDPEKWQSVFRKDHAPTNKPERIPLRLNRDALWFFRFCACPYFAHVLIGKPVSTRIKSEGMLFRDMR
jgi:hypothetical protein